MGGLPLDELWRQHNEHRIVIPRVLMVLMARATGWRIGWELALTIGLAVGVFLAFITRIKTVGKSAAAGRIGWLRPILALSLFSMSQWQTWLWGWNLQTMLVLFLVVFGLLILTARPIEPTALVFAGLLGVLATLSYGAGLAFWPIGAVAIALDSGVSAKKRLVRTMLWCLVSAAVAFSYLHGYKETFNSYRMHHMLLAGSLEYWGKFVKYSLCYLGAPLAAGSVPRALIIGGVGMVWFACCALASVRRRSDRSAQVFVLLGLFALGSALMSALGRGRLGPSQALESRYITISSLLWDANVGLLGCMLLSGKLGESLGLSGRLKRWTAVAAISATVVLLCVGTESGRSAARERSEFLSPAARELLSLRDDNLLHRLYPNVSILKRNAKVLRQRGLSVYRTEAGRPGSGRSGARP